MYIFASDAKPNEKPSNGHRTRFADHLFIVTQGEAKVLLDGQERIIRENEAFVVKGGIPHSVWNNAQAETVMIGITLKNNENGK